MEQTLKQMALAVYKKEVIPALNFSLTDMEGALREKVRELAPDFNTYRKNKYELFELIQEVVDEVAPKKIEAAIGQFAEVKTYGQGDKPRFRKKLGRKNVKRFITKVGLGGVYERVRLDQDFIDVQTHAIGGAAYIEFEHFLSGQMEWAELIDLIIDGIELAIYKEIRVALISTYSSLPAANKFTGASFDADEMVSLITTVKAYGGNANIIATPEFAATIMASPNFIGDADKADYRNQGYVGRFAGANVIVLPQSFEDDSNETKVFDPEYAFVIPTGGTADEKIVKVALEGQSVVKEVENSDSSIEFQSYKKIGVVVLSTNYYSIYRNTSL
ncbi:hypothetical protein ACFQZE_07345 [Paenibacillus sp. GCM10027627]|uniref:hypothetical protein n=1 Tax=unclassified Paenibacillus TaxID=185978 RepID=UPI003642FA82